VKRALVFLGALLLGACASTPPPAERQASAEARPPTVQPRPPARGGGYYKDDGPGENPPANLASIPDAKPKREPLNRSASRPYVRFGKFYEPMAEVQPFRQRGIASWYGRQFHGQKTSSGDTYDMYAMTAAHPTLPIPSYARVTNLANGRSVIVRVNDRGPFHSDRIIDLSYAAAYKLGFAAAGSAQVELESIVPGDTQVAAAPPTPPAAPPPAGVGDSGSVYLQLGAFASRENAEDLRSRIARQLSWLTDAIQVLSSGNLWRLNVGPYRSNEAARSVAQRIEAELGLKPLLVAR
jgi:peptidoglycan lytic transglycosylase